jgi:hypothetical protein
MSKLDKDQVIAAFKEAYTAVNGKVPVIEAKGGWYSVDDGKNIRLAGLDAMTAELNSLTLTKENNAVIKEPLKATNKKPAADIKAAKVPATKKVKKSDFSVKAFWAEKIFKQIADSKVSR